MAIVYSYPYAEVKPEDILLGSKFVGEQGMVVKNFSVADVIALAQTPIPVTTQDLKLSFNWGTETAEFEVLNGKYNLLGIDFQTLVMEEGATYTLLLDRQRSSEWLGNLHGLRRRRNKYNHEWPADALINGRTSEYPITMIKGQYFDINPEKYFRVNETTPGSWEFKGGTGNPGKNRRRTRASKVNFVNLAFRIRIEKDGVIVETNTLGTVSMNIQYIFPVQLYGSFARANS